jgi:hypothetical protein
LATFFDPSGVETPVAAQLGYFAGRIWRALRWTLPLAAVVRKMMVEADCVSTRMAVE